MNERTNERLARHIVSTVLNVPVERFEDGTSPSQIDALIQYADKRGALEIIADHEADFNRQWDALEKIRHRVRVPGLGSGWAAQVRRKASIRKISSSLPSVMLQLKEHDQLSNGWRGSAMPPPLSALGVLSLRPAEGLMDEVVLHAEGWSGTADNRDHVLARWVENVLKSQSDVPEKLGRHAASEKHAFIWTTIGSSYSVQFLLEDTGQELPCEAPRLPAGVTHLWVAGSFNSQGCLAWFPDRGWWRTPWQWPSDPLELPN